MSEPEWERERERHFRTPPPLASSLWDEREYGQYINSMGPSPLLFVLTVLLSREVLLVFSFFITFTLLWSSKEKRGGKRGEEKREKERRGGNRRGEEKRGEEEREKVCSKKKRMERRGRE